MGTLLEQSYDVKWWLHEFSLAAEQSILTVLCSALRVEGKRAVVLVLPMQSLTTREIYLALFKYTLKIQFNIFVPSQDLK